MAEDKDKYIAASQWWNSLSRMHQSRLITEYQLFTTGYNDLDESDLMLVYFNEGKK